MSGETYTYVNMRQDRVNELTRQARRTDALEAQKRLLEQQQQAREAQTRQLRQRLTDNEARYERHVRSLGQDIQALEKQTRARFEQQRKAYQQGLEETARRQRQYTDQQVKGLNDQMQHLDARLSGDIRKVDDRVTALAESVRHDLGAQRQEYLHLFQEQDRHFQDALQQQGAILQANIDTLADQISQRLHNEREIAEAWIGHLRQEIEFIRDRYRHEQFAPGELAQLDNRLQLAANNLAQGIYQTAIGTGQEGFLQARQLRERLELLEMHWEHYRQLAYESATAALLLIDEHTLIDYRLEGDQALQVQVDYWTEGRWQALRDQVNALRQQTENAQSSVTTDELKALQQAAEHAHDQALALVVTAKTAALSSIKRRDVQDIILERLTELGFQYQDSSYEGEDFRRAYHLKLRNGSGDELVTIVAPEGESFNNRLTFSFFDQSPNEQVREERLCLIREQIENEGEMKVGPMQCEQAYAGDNAPEARRDFTQVRTARKPQPTH